MLNESRAALSLPFLIACIIALTGCAEPAQEEDTSHEGDASFPVTVESPGGGQPVTLESPPGRIVSLSPSVTEVLYALGAGDQVVAVDEMSDFPEHAPTTDMSGLTPNPETISSHEPDLVLIESDTEGLADSLAAADIETLVIPDAESLDEAYQRYSVLGRATGHEEASQELISETQEAIEQSVTRVGDTAGELSYYHELDPTYYTATSATFIGDIYELFGLDNIADGDDPTALGGYPQLSAERILEADPDLIFLADTECCGQDSSTVAERPGWDTLRAVTEDAVIELDDDVASRWGPRIVEMVDEVAEAVAESAP